MSLTLSRGLTVMPGRDFIFLNLLTSIDGDRPKILSLAKNNYSILKKMVLSFQGRSSDSLLASIIPEP